MKKRLLSVLLTLSMVLTLLPGTAWASDGGDGAAAATQSVTSSKDNITINKKVEGNADDGYTLTLEAYASNTVTTTTTTKPLDIVLVLDQSGSMAYNFAGNSTGDNAQRRQYAMKQAVNSFIASVAAQYSEASDHRMAIVTFANGASTLKGWTAVDSTGKEQLTQLVNKLPDAPKGATNVGAGMTQAQTLVNSSSSENNRQKVVIVFTDGVPTTGTEFNVTVANTAIGSAKDMKDAGVTIYTVGIFDGADPDQLHGDVYDRANILGIEDDPCNGNIGEFWGYTNANAWSGGGKESIRGLDIAATNRFLNFLSSNFNTATSIGIQEYNSVGALRGQGWRITDNFDRSDTGYYLTASNADGLSGVFQTIYENINSLQVYPDTSAVLTDTLSKYFNFPSEINASEDVKVSYVEAEAVTDGVIIWKEEASSLPDGTSINFDGKTITVTGFDYYANAVTVTDGAVSGGKLVVSFPIELDAEASAEGGILPTNNTTNSQAGLKYKLTADAGANEGATLLTESPSVEVEEEEAALPIEVSFVRDDGDGSTAPIVYPAEMINDGEEATPPETDGDKIITDWLLEGTSYEGSYTYEALSAIVTELGKWGTDCGYLTFVAVYEEAIEPEKPEETYNVYFSIPNSMGGKFNPHNEGHPDRYNTEATYDKVSDTYYVYFPEVELNKGYELTGWRVVGSEIVRLDAIAWMFTGVEQYAIDYKLTIEAIVEATGSEPVDPTETYKVHFVINNAEGGSFEPHDADDPVRYNTEATYDEEFETYRVTFPTVELNEGYELTGWRIVGKKTVTWDPKTWMVEDVQNYANGYDLTIEAIVEATGSEPVDPTETYKVHFVINNAEGGSFEPHDADDPVRYNTVATYDEEFETYRVTFPTVVLNEGYELTGWRIVGKKTVTWDPKTWMVEDVQNYANGYDLVIEAIVVPTGSEPVDPTETYKVHFVINNAEGGSFDPHDADDPVRYNTAATYNEEFDTYRVTFPKVKLNEGYELTGWRIVGKKTVTWDSDAWMVEDVQNYANGYDLVIEAIVVPTGSEPVDPTETYKVHFVINNAEGGSFDPHDADDPVRYNTEATYIEEFDTYRVTFPTVDLNEGYELTGWRIVGKETVTWDSETWMVEDVQNYANGYDLVIEAIVEAIVPDEPDEPDEPKEPETYVLTGFDKALVTSSAAVPTWAAGISVPNGRGVVEVYYGNTVKLLYTLTVTGETGAAYTITDADAAIYSVNGYGYGSSVSGVLGSSGSAVYYAIKSFSVYSDAWLSNTASVTAGTNTTAPGTPSVTETVWADVTYPYYPQPTPPVTNPETPDEVPAPDRLYEPSFLNTEDHYAYITGYSDGLVRPTNDITRAEVATIFFRLLTDEARETYWSQENSYSDVDANAWYNNAVSTLSRMGVIGGYPDGRFGPNDTITRAEFVTIATRFFGYTAQYTGAFLDVDASDWYADYVQAGVDLGLVSGYPNGSFDPSGAITRAEACTIVNRVLGRVPHKDHLLSWSAMVTWIDNENTNAWYYADIQEATNSHDYEWTLEGTTTVEQWTEKLAERDWAALERTWG